MEQGSQAFVVIGGIGSGKSFVCSLLASAGVEVIEADRIGHSVLSDDGDGFASVAERWPETVAGGQIDRRALGRIVFEDRSQLAELEAITHPLIVAEIERAIDRSSKELVAIERPLIDGEIGDGLPVVVIDADADVRVDRLRRRGMADDEISSRMAAQPDRELWLAAGDFVIDNNPGADLDEQVKALIRQLRNYVTQGR